MSGFHVPISSAPRRRCWRTKGRRALSATVDVDGILRGDYGAGFCLYHLSGVDFAMNSPMAVLAPAGTADVVASAAQVVSSWGFSITPDTLNQIASEVGEQLDYFPCGRCADAGGGDGLHPGRCAGWYDGCGVLVSLRHSV
ncbi:hypothetical protein ACNKHT_03455 [Shigella flexneri]